MKSTNMTALWVLGLSAIFASIATQGATSASASHERPNFLIIVADDLGYSDIGAYGGEIATPNIDRLAAEGVSLTNFYNMSRCSPSRASLLTGRYPHRVGMGENGGSMSPDVRTVAEELKRAGYATAMVGKWHLTRATPIADPVEHLKWVNHQAYFDRDFGDRQTYPAARGFETHYGMVWGVGSYFDPFSLVEQFEPVRSVPKGFYLTDALSDRAVTDIGRLARADKPFLMYLAYTAPHWPLQAPAQAIAKYRKRYERGWEELRKERHARQIELGLIDRSMPLSELAGDWSQDPGKSWSSLSERERAMQAEKMAVHAAMVDVMDQGIGRVLAALQASGQYDNTVIVFLSDNGASPETMSAAGYKPGYDRPSETRDGRPISYEALQPNIGADTSMAGIGAYWANAANTPWRYWKAEAYDGGTHTPFIISWPKGMKRKPGARAQDFAHVIDITPTMYELARVRPTLEGQPPIDGISLAPVLNGRHVARTEPLFFEHEGSRAIIDGDWKLVARAPGPRSEEYAPWSLYNLARDRAETRDVIAQEPERAKQLAARWAEWSTAVKARQRREPAKRPADDIFLDHPSMDKNATVAPAPDARPIASMFAEKPMLDASLTRTDSGVWYLTGTVLRDMPRDGVQLWTSTDRRQWRALGIVHAKGERVLAPKVLARGKSLYLTYTDAEGCARVARGSIDAPTAAYVGSPCLFENTADASLFIDDNGSSYLLWGAGWIARLSSDMDKLAEAPRFLKPDPKLFATNPPPGKDWPVRTRVGSGGATMFKDEDKYVLAANEVTGRMRSPTDDVFMATAPTPYGPFSMRFLAVPHASQTTIVRDADGTLLATYNPKCEDDFALFCEQVGVVPLERAPDGRLRQAARVLTEDSAVASRGALLTSEKMRDPSVTLGGDGQYYLVGTQGGFGFTYPTGGITMWQSSDLKRWDKARMIFEWQGLGHQFKNVAELWAPEIQWSARDRTFYVAFSIMERDVGGKTWLYRSKTGSAEGPYENVTSGPFVEGIDGFVFEDDDGLYLIWGGGRIGKLNAKRDGFDGPVSRLVDVDGENIGYEGNAVIKVNGVYFVTGAEWNGPLRTHGTYDMMYGTSTSLFGPYTKRKLGAPHAGHGTPFRDKEGRYWTTLFGNDVTAPWRRHFGLAPLEIGDDRAIRVLSAEDHSR
jgi:arylsulfatase A-like enzyme/beta-xylosidase